MSETKLTPDEAFVKIVESIYLLAKEVDALTAAQLDHIATDLIWTHGDYLKRNE